MWAVKNLRFLLPFFLLKSVSLGKNVFFVLFYFFKPCKVGSNAAFLAELRPNEEFSFLPAKP